jgi:transcriptional regulator with XRE-family HTH domain
MSNYTFADLLHIFFRFHQDEDKQKTQEELAREVGVSLRTINNWFKSDYVPRSPEIVERLARALGLTAFQADLMLSSINPKWVRYGTPLEVLRTAEVVRYREEEIPYQADKLLPVPSIVQIESEWRVTFADTFENNHNFWGLGIKNDGTGEIERRMEQRRYVLSLRNLFHTGVFMGGDSHCFAPDIYYVSVHAAMVEGEPIDDGYCLIFEEVSDGCHAIFRIREQLQQASVVQTFNGGGEFKIYMRRAAAPSLRPGKVNKLAILAIHQDHWFYINDHLIGHRSIPRLPSSRLDVGVVANSKQPVTSYFQEFRVYVPQATRMYPALEKIIGMALE